MSLSGATSDLPTQIHQVAPFISSDNQGPFRLFHPDFAVHNVVVDDEYNILSLIDWEFAFVGPSELATQQALQYRTYPLAILAIVPGVMDKNGNVIDQSWRAAFQQRSEFIAAVSSQENRLDVSSAISTRINSVQADICWLMQMWMQKMPWILNYSPGIQNGVDTILKAVREA
jgi:aminoglycoside phosphotransferase (APT) family kinase protein